MIQFLIIIGEPANPFEFEPRTKHSLRQIRKRPKRRVKSFLLLLFTEAARLSHLQYLLIEDFRIFRFMYPFDAKRYLQIHRQQTHIYRQQYIERLAIVCLIGQLNGAKFAEIIIKN